MIALRLVPFKVLTLEQSIEFIADDELVGSDAEVVENAEEGTGFEPAAEGPTVVEACWNR